MQPQQGQMVQGFSDPQTVAQPTMVGGQHVLTVPEQSPAPTWMGVIMILWGLLVGIIGFYNIISATGEGIPLVQQLVGILTAAAIGVGGFLTFQRKKLGVWLGLGAVGLNTVMGIIVSMGVRAEAGGVMGDLQGGCGLIAYLILGSFCALMIAIPLMATGSNLE
ncbi:MAG: hypothetical protein OSB33_04410 [Candidatus Poseidoniales archaeon]|nr:hypothetical protein [Candidatus Poseidoniales archaeon]